MFSNLQVNKLLCGPSDRPQESHQPTTDRRSTARIPNPVVAIVLLLLEHIDLVVKRLDVAEGLLDRRLVAAGFLAPAVVVVDVLLAPAVFRLDLEANLALLLEVQGLGLQFHAAGLAGAVLGLTVRPEVAPLPVAACVGVLIVEAHGGDGWVWAVCQFVLAVGVMDDGHTGCVGVWSCCGGKLIGM